MIIGHQKIISYLEKAADCGRLPHGLIFEGPKNIGKTTVARWFAAKLLNTEESRLAIHPDFISLAPDGGIIKDQIDEVIGKLRLTAFAGGYKVALIEDAHLINISAANAFLKTLEEPSKNTIIILLTPQLGKILPTIISRAVILHFKPVPKDDIRQFLKDRRNCADAKSFAALSCGCPGRAINALMDSEEINYAPKAEEFYQLFFGPAPGRWAAVSAMLGKKNETDKEIIYKKINFWLEILRDACFFKYNLHDSIVYIKGAAMLEKIAQIKTASELASLGGKLIKMRELIFNNINIKLMLENLII